jgi:hypothetical protein
LYNIEKKLSVNPFPKVIDFGILVPEIASQLGMKANSDFIITERLSISLFDLNSPIELTKFECINMCCSVID